MMHTSGLPSSPKNAREWPEIVFALFLLVGGIAAFFTPLDNPVIRYIAAVTGVLIGFIGLVGHGLRTSSLTPSRWTLVERWDVQPDLWRRYLETTKKATLEAVAVVVGFGLIIFGLIVVFALIDNADRLWDTAPMFLVMLGPLIAMIVVHIVANHVRRIGPPTVWIYQEGIVVGRLVNSWREDGSLRSVAPAKECDYPALEFNWRIGRRGAGMERAPIATEAVEVRNRVLAKFAGTQPTTWQPPVPPVPR